MVKNGHKVLVAIVGERIASERESHRRLYALSISRCLRRGRDETPGRQACVLFWVDGMRYGLDLFRVLGKNYRGAQARIDPRS
jgi:hypothetical protein